jgi:hypothetical protein
VDIDPNVGLYASLALDGDGYAHIAYYDIDKGKLKYAHQDASGWHIETLDNQANISESYNSVAFSIAIDGNGFAKISYTVGGDLDRELKIADQDAAGWHIQALDNVRAGGVSLKLGKDGYARISYATAKPALKFAYQDLSGWHIQALDPASGSIWSDTTLVMDPDDHPHISYYISNALKYAFQDASGWRIQTVTSEPYYGYHLGLNNSMALDANGAAIISYYDEDGGDLKLAHQVSAPFSIYLPLIKLNAP